jgi:DNA-binding NtrC family response regulator
MMADGDLIDIVDLPERLRGPLSEDLGGDEKFLSLEELQRRHILRVLEGSGGNKARAAKVLGIGRTTIYQLLSTMKTQEPQKGPHSGQAVSLTALFRSDPARLMPNHKPVS